jgi:hypothetical protein
VFIIRQTGIDNKDNLKQPCRAFLKRLLFPNFDRFVNTLSKNDGCKLPARVGNNIPHRSADIQYIVASQAQMYNLL